MTSKPVELKKENFTIQIKYSPEAVEKKLIKFITKSGDEIVISAEEMISILVSQVNSETLSPTFVETDKINVVEVERQIKCVLDKDYKKGQEININYIHPYAVEFALIEEAYKIARIKKDIPVFTLTKEYLDEVRKKLKPEMKSFVQRVYEGYKNLKIDKTP
jgi:hypothetical protein